MMAIKPPLTDLPSATAEPIHHFGTDPDVIAGTVAVESAEVVRSAYKWFFLHWGRPLPISRGIGKDGDKWGVCRCRWI